MDVLWVWGGGQSLSDSTEDLGQEGSARPGRPKDSHTDAGRGSCSQEGQPLLSRQGGERAQRDMLACCPQARAEETAGRKAACTGPASA